jgi:hypothetical protein
MIPRLEGGEPGHPLKPGPGFPGGPLETDEAAMWPARCPHEAEKLPGQEAVGHNLRAGPGRTARQVLTSRLTTEGSP